MAEELNIVLEHLRALRDGQEQLDRKAALIDDKITTIGHHMSGFMTHLSCHDDEMAEVKSRIERIEKRLGLIDDVH